ncbi:DUF881 domain-containing protein [Xylanimonas sp. McL0601]|uniref:DUF881 domain-containing protein n=1 Tax=Xylanimonas sp. McL0601 TaxID=3414739 RepID=UPI003CF52023
MTDAVEKPGETQETPREEAHAPTGAGAVPRETGAVPGEAEAASAEAEAEAAPPAEPEAPAEAVAPDEAEPPAEVAPQDEPEPAEPTEPGEPREEQPTLPPAEVAPEPPSTYRRLARGLRPTFSRSQLLAGLLCALLGFALVVQVRQSGQDELSSLRQDDLVRLLDEVTGRAEQLDAEVSHLQASRDELASGTGKAHAALELAQQRATSEGILSGRLPAQGPGVVVEIGDPQRQLRAAQMFNLLEELRNAGAEVAQVNDVRLVTSSAFVDGAGSIVVDGTTLTPPYRWTVIGDPATLDRALEIPGGALPTIRQAGASASTTREDQVTVDATVRLTDPRFARPVEPDNG